MSSSGSNPPDIAAQEAQRKKEAAEAAAKADIDAQQAAQAAQAQPAAQAQAQPQAQQAPQAQAQQAPQGAQAQQAPQGAQAQQAAQAAIQAQQAAEAAQKRKEEAEAAAKARKEGNDLWARSNDQYRKMADNYLAAKGIVIPQYYKRPKGSEQTNPQRESAFSLNSGENARDPMGPGRYHAHGKAPFDLILDASGKVTAVWAPKEDRPSSGVQQYQFSNAGVREAKIRAMIEFQIARGCHDLVFDCPSKRSAREWMRIAQEYPIKYKFKEDGQLNDRLKRDVGTQENGRAASLARIASIDTFRETIRKAAEDSEYRYNEKILPHVAGGKKRVDYNKDINELQSNERLNAQTSATAKTNFEGLPNIDEKVTAATDKIDDLNKRLDQLKTLHKGLTKDIENLVTELNKARTSKEVDAVMMKYEIAMDKRNDLNSLMKLELAALDVQKNLCDDMVQHIGGIDNAKAIPLKAKIKEAKLNEVKNAMADVPNNTPDPMKHADFKKMVQDKKTGLQEEQKLAREQQQQSRRGPGIR